MLGETNAVPASHAIAANRMDRRNLIHAFIARLTCFVLLGLFLAGLEPAAAYGVLTHNQLVDQAWASGIVPLLLSRYPSLTAEQLREAHAFAYGGCLIQDFGYYPFANSFMADLMHYVRSGDFVESLFHNAQNADELAVAVGALSHFIGGQHRALGGHESLGGARVSQAQSEVWFFGELCPGQDSVRPSRVGV